MFTIYSADVTGNPGNCSYLHKHVILDEDSLKAAICHDYVCAEYKNSYRNGDNFIGSDCLPVDCDNDHSENPDDWVKKAGGIAPKFVSPSFAGMPDRLILLPDGKFAFAELKAPGESPRPLQKARHRLLRSLGFRVYVIDSIEQIGGMIDELRTS